ncbi:MAG TPA: hypothetical protein VGR59_09585 [Gemmatimonadaceae bacterium]|nr:hypothetical protein [Gemmatimonadaceae bacterium]
MRRLPPNATPDQMARAYADALLFVLQTQPQELEKLRETNDRMQAIVAVSDATCQRASNAATRLETTAQRIETTQERITSDIARLNLTVGRLEGQVSHLASALGVSDATVEQMREKVATIPEIARAVTTAVEASRKLAEEVDEITDHGQERPPKPGTPSEHVRAIAVDVVHTKQVEQYANRWLNLEKSAISIARAVVAALLIAALGFLWGHLAK